MKKYIFISIGLAVISIFVYTNGIDMHRHDQTDTQLSPQQETQESIEQKDPRPELTTQNMPPSPQVSSFEELKSYIESENQIPKAIVWKRSDEDLFFTIKSSSEILPPELQTSAFIFQAPNGPAQYDVETLLVLRDNLHQNNTVVYNEMGADIRDVEIFEQHHVFFHERSLGGTYSADVVVDMISEKTAYKEYAQPTAEINYIAMIKKGSPDIEIRLEHSCPQSCWVSGQITDEKEHYHLYYSGGDGVRHFLGEFPNLIDDHSNLSFSRKDIVENMQQDTYVYFHIAEDRYQIDTTSFSVQKIEV